MLCDSFRVKLRTYVFDRSLKVPSGLQAYPDLEHGKVAFPHTVEEVAAAVLCAELAKDGERAVAC